MNWSHIFTAVIVLAIGYWLGRKYPTALASIPVLGS
jgi:hypothetical protein